MIFSRNFMYDIHNCCYQGTHYSPEQLLKSFSNFVFSAPFTIQRLAELVVEPRKHYKRTDKFLRAIEKVREH